MIIKIALLVFLLIQPALMATGVTTIRESEVEFSAGILITDTIDEVSNPVTSYPKDELVENYLNWFANNEAERGTINITLLPDDSSGDSLYVYVKNIIFDGPDDLQLGVSTSIAENYHGGIQGISLNVITNSYTDPTDPSGAEKSNYFTSMQVGAGKFDESIWILENDNGEIIVDAYKSVDFGYNPAGDQNLAINALGGDVVFFDNMVVTSRVSTGCVGLNMSYEEMLAGDCDTYGLKVKGNVKFDKLFGKVGDIQATFNSGISIYDAPVLAYDDTPWAAVSFNPTSELNSNSSFTIDLQNSVPITYNFAIMSQYTVKAEYDVTIQGWMVVDAWNENCDTLPGEIHCPLIGDGSLDDCDVIQASNRYARPGSFTHEEQLHVSNLSIFDYQQNFDEIAPFYYQFGFAAPLEKDAIVSIRVRHCLAPGVGKDNHEYQTISLKDIQDYPNHASYPANGNGSGENSSKFGDNNVRYFQIENISATIYAVPSW